MEAKPLTTAMMNTLEGRKIALLNIRFGKLLGHLEEYRVGSERINEGEFRVSQSRLWYLPNRTSQEALGPYTDDQILGWLRAGSIRVDEFICGSHWASSEWKRIGGTEEFRDALLEMPNADEDLAWPESSPIESDPGFENHRVEEVKAAGPVSDLANLRPPVVLSHLPDSPIRLHEPHPEMIGALNYSTSNRYRRFPRTPIRADAILHDNQSRFIRATCVDISENGIYVYVTNLDVFEKGEELMVTVRNAPGIGTFSAPCAVIRVISESGEQGYGLSFLRISPVVRRQITRYVLSRMGREELEPVA